MLRDIATVIADHGANILMINQEIFEFRLHAGMGELYLEYEPGPNREQLVRDLEAIGSVRDVKNFQPFGDIFGSRVIIIGGGAQVAQVALGAVNEADRHNIRGERISVDTIPLVGERTLALAVDAVSRLPRASILVLARVDHGRGYLKGGRPGPGGRYPGHRAQDGGNGAPACRSGRHRSDPGRSICRHAREQQGSIRYHPDPRQGILNGYHRTGRVGADA